MRCGLLHTDHKHSEMGNPLPPPVRVLCSPYNSVYCSSICALQSVWPGVCSRCIGGMEHGSCKAVLVGSLDRASVGGGCRQYDFWHGAFQLNQSLSVDPVTLWC